jgi:hypothetical protein
MSLKTAGDRPKLKVNVVSGPEGPSLYINDRRVAGPKPWGGGRILYSWKADPADIEAALAKNRQGRQAS